MSRTWVPDYPEAPLERAKYESILDALRREGGKIKNAAFLTIKDSSQLIDSTNTLEGEYYDIYGKRVTDWIAEVQRIADVFKAFEIELNVRIRNANAQYMLWSGRESLGHWEEDTANGKQNYSPY